MGPTQPRGTIEDLRGRKSSGSGLESREYGRRDPLLWPRDTLYPQKMALTSPESCGLSVGIVRSRTKATESYYLLEETDFSCRPIVKCLIDPYLELRYATMMESRATSYRCKQLATRLAISTKLNINISLSIDDTADCRNVCVSGIPHIHNRFQHNIWHIGPIIRLNHLLCNLL
jgi:hypothetical protein